jgi:hypothetical protein
VLDDPRIPDAGGFCRVSSSSTTSPTPTATVGVEGDKCDRFTFPLDPPCGPGLVCVLTDPMIPDLGGVCRRSASASAKSTLATVTVTVTGACYG